MPTLLRPLLPFLVLLLLAPVLVRAEEDEDRKAVQDLERQLKKGDQAERLEALHRIARAARRLEAPRRRKATVVITKRLPEERDGAVRAKMIRSLARLGGVNGWVPVILAWTGRKDPAVVAEARQALLWGGGDYLETVGRLLREDKDPTFRARLLLLVGDRRQRDAVPLVLERLEKDGHPRVESAAVEALEAISGEALGYDATRWRAWWTKANETQETPSAGEGVTVADDRPDPIPEPAPHVPRSLQPTFYDLKLTAKDIVFVLDVSGSVGKGGVGKAKRELIRAVERLGSDVRMAALFFDEKVRMWKPEMVPATPENKAALALFLRAIKPGRRTDVFTPLHAGLQIIRRRVQEKKDSGEPIREAVTMIVVSDGVETQQSTPRHLVADKLARLDPTTTVVHAVALGKGSRLLMEIARRAGGHYVQAK